MASFYSSDVADFLALNEEQILARLETAYAKYGYTRKFSDQTLTWSSDIESLRKCLRDCVAQLSSAQFWGILLEFSIPRKEFRIDAVLLVQDVVVPIEAKSGSAVNAARRQVEEYALLLHYFHRESDQRRVVPVVVTSSHCEPDLSVLNQREFFPQLPSYWISSVVQSTWQTLPSVLLNLTRDARDQIAYRQWDTSPYFPIPSILKAAVELRSGLSIREIAHSEASLEEIEQVRGTVQEALDKARRDRRHTICFLTGVPGSGKTLVGLSLAHSQVNKSEPIHFMSGNGPLVKVLQHLFTQESRRSGASAAQANAEAKTLIENVHVFARYHTEENLEAPSNHAIIFDEAQRAWNQAQNMKKFQRNYSEPEMLLRIMERHSDWALVVALVGGGQEINDGEAGLEEWGRALSSSQKDWQIYASPEVLEGGTSTAGHRLFSEEQPKSITATPTLHLKTSRRSLRADQLAAWVNGVVDGDARGARSLGITGRFPLFLTRDLDSARDFVRRQAIGENRCGLVGSSGAARLRKFVLSRRVSMGALVPS